MVRTTTLVVTIAVLATAVVASPVVATGMHAQHAPIDANTTENDADRLNEPRGADGNQTEQSGTDASAATTEVHGRGRAADTTRSAVTTNERVATSPSGQRGVPCWKLWPQVDFGEPCIPSVEPTLGDDPGVDGASDTGSSNGLGVEPVPSSNESSALGDISGSLLCQKLYGAQFCLPTVGTADL